MFPQWHLPSIRMATPIVGRLRLHFAAPERGEILRRAIEHVEVDEGCHSRQRATVRKLPDPPLPRIFEARTHEDVPRPERMRMKASCHIGIELAGHIEHRAAAQALL